MKKLGAVLRIEINPTKDAWTIAIVHRSPDGHGITPVFSTHGKFQAVLAHINNAVDTYGVER